MGRIRYGIKNVHYAVATAGQDESLTYATPVAIPGAKSISLDAQGESVDEYADNVTWWHGDVNNGYSGTLEFEDTAASETFINTVLSHTKDSTTGVVTEKASDQQKEFALGFEFTLDGGTETGKRIWMLRCKISRPQISGSTKEANVAAQTQSVNLTCIARAEDEKVKTSAVSTDSAYSTWFSAVVD